MQNASYESEYLYIQLTLNQTGVGRADHLCSQKSMYMFDSPKINLLIACRYLEALWQHKQLVEKYFVYYYMLYFLYVFVMYYMLYSYKKAREIMYFSNCHKSLKYFPIYIYWKTKSHVCNRPMQFKPVWQVLFIHLSGVHFLSPEGRGRR